MQARLPVVVTEESFKRTRGRYRWPSDTPCAERTLSGCRFLRKGVRRKWGMNEMAVERLCQSCPANLNHTSRRVRYLYVLTDPRSDAVRYVGVTTDPAARLETHLQLGKSANPHVNAWIRLLLNMGLQPRIEVLACNSYTEAQAMETDLIKACSKAGINLLNGQHYRPPKGKGKRYRGRHFARIHELPL